MRTARNKRLVSWAFVGSLGAAIYAPWVAVKAVSFVAMLATFGLWLWVAWEPRDNLGADKPFD
ncbi:hypothetical protein [Massilia aerilata]|uniref:DUF3329 domain-containing protein n=1 Tax=Massilia aerilata TaxID=453817 RepID=A0ABW0S4Q9_9BURK